VLVERGARVAVMDVQVDEKKVAERFGDQRENPNLMFVALDITSRASVEAGLQQVVDR
jgi:NAD(P)-dependent dehydrogenase (short-subunit alcohol dehydrogenase family)